MSEPEEAEIAPEDAAEAPDEEAFEASPEPAPMREALAWAGGVTVACAAGVGFAFSPDRAGSPWMLGAMGLLYGVLGTVTVLRLRRRGELQDEMRPASGDVTIGALVAALQYGVAMAVHMLVTAPPSPRSAWIMRLYVSLGDPDAQGRLVLGGVVFLIAALEELTWRGLVMRILTDPLGPIRAWLLSALLFGVAHLPTLFLLGDPRVGPNPLLVAAGIAYSLVWGRVAMRMGRLPPAILAHALFTWSVFEFPIWRP